MFFLETSFRFYRIHIVFFQKKKFVIRNSGGQSTSKEIISSTGVEENQFYRRIAPTNQHTQQKLFAYK